MIEFSLVELLMVAVIALVVIGPKDMPKVLKSVLGLFRQIQSMAADLRKSVDELVDESGIKDAEREVKTLIDQNGDLQEIYDISEFLEEKNPPKIDLAAPKTKAVADE